MDNQKYNRSGTRTSRFGTPGRINHDSSEFYSSKLYNEFKVPDKIEYTENTIPFDKLNRIYCKSSETMDEIPDNSIHLMITSPPYNAKKEYDEDLSLQEYRNLLYKVFKETYKN